MEERLDKIIASMGQYSRKEVRKLIRDGQILIDQKRAEAPDRKIDPAKHSILLCGKELCYEKYVYLMLNKPGGVVTATKDSRNKTVIDLLPGEYQNRDLFPVGRLDKDTEGLLLITNDGELAHALLSPARHVAKVYEVTVEGSPGKKEQEAFAEGITLADGSVCREAQLVILEHNTVDGICTSRVIVTLKEGMYHQIKRMFGVFSMPVIHLKRLQMGPLILDDSLAVGEMRRLTEKETDALLQLKTQSGT